MKTFGKVLAFLLGVGTIIAGTYCLFSPGVSNLVLIYIIGIVMIVDAIIKFISWFSLRKDLDGDGLLLASAIISLIIGAFLVADGFVQWMLDVIIVYSIAVWIIVSGILRIVRAFKIKDLKGAIGKTLGRYWWILLIFGIAFVALGIFLLFNPIVTSVVIGIIIAIAIICVGANLLTFAIA